MLLFFSPGQGEAQSLVETRPNWGPLCPQDWGLVIAWGELKSSGGTWGDRGASATQMAFREGGQGVVEQAAGKCLEGLSDGSGTGRSREGCRRVRLRDKGVDVEVRACVTGMGGTGLI